MAKRKKLEQHIAVFGESGSGKTVMLSSFFGAMRQPGLAAERHFSLVANKPAQGTRLLQRYFEMKDKAEVPLSNRHRADTYEFSLQLARAQGGGGGKPQHFDAVKLFWHDYPGEWFEQDVNGETEAERRVELFRKLLVSDVALLLVDGQKLRENAGEEERYLGKLFGNLSNCLLAMKDDLLEEGAPLVQFPRIWVLALSKADLLPEMTVSAFEQLVTREAGHHLNELRFVIQGFVKGDEALAIGEDLLLLSSAKFEPGKIDVNRRVGIDLLLPLAAMLPFERHLQWARAKKIPTQVARELLKNTDKIFYALAAASGMLTKLKLPGPLKAAAIFVAGIVSSGAASEIVDMADSKLEEAYENARKKNDDLGAILTKFRIDLNRAEHDDVLLRGDR